MEKLRKRFWLSLLILISVLSLIVLINNHNVFARAESGSLSGEVSDESDKEVQPRLFTNLSLAIKSENGKIITTVRNDFTLFPSTVVVIVELYSSEYYFESYLNAELVDRQVTQDLDMGNSISAEASIGGVQKYWQGRMRYKIDNGSWEERNTGTVIYSANGEFLGYA